MKFYSGNSQARHVTSLRQNVSLYEQSLDTCESTIVQSWLVNKKV
jgi:hypothetical protein